MLALSAIHVEPSKSCGAVKLEKPIEECQAPRAKSQPRQLWIHMYIVTYLYVVIHQQAVSAEHDVIVLFHSFSPR